MLKNKGSSLSQYALIIALIALALVPVFYVFGGTIIAYFEGLYKGLSTKDLSISETTKESGSPTIAYKAGSFGGTQDNPVLQCADGNCNIDYGEFILEGIPEDFTEYVESHGTSGGTEELVNLLLQMADQMEEKGLEEQASNIRDIANLGHYIAQIEKTYENMANDCITEKQNHTACLSMKLREDKYMPNKEIPANVANLVPEYVNAEYTNSDSKVLGVIGPAINIGEAVLMFNNYREKIDTIPYRNHGLPAPSQINELESFLEEESKRYPAYAVAYKYDKIMNDPAVPESVRDVTSTMLQYMTDLAAAHQAKATLIWGPNLTTYYDINISTKTKYGSKTRADNLDEVLKPQTNFKTNISSALICVSGKHRTTGKSCF